jgi:hypothetical protein
VSPSFFKEGGLIMKKFFLIVLMISAFLSVTSCGSSASSKFKVYGAPTASAAVANVTDDNNTYYGSPTSLKITMYAVWVGTNADCTGLVSVADYGTTGQVFDIFDNPVLFQGNPPDGTYNCMVLKISDTMTFIPAQSGGTYCVAGTPYTFNVAINDPNLPLVDNNFNPIVIDAGPSAIYIFATTDNTKTAAKNVSIDQTIPLTAAMVSPGQVTLVMDFTNRVYVQPAQQGIPTTQCWLDSPTMSFK